MKGCSKTAALVTAAALPHQCRGSAACNASEGGGGGRGKAVNQGRSKADGQHKTDNEGRGVGDVWQAEYTC